MSSSVPAPKETSVTSVSATIVPETVSWDQPEMQQSHESITSTIVGSAMPLTEPPSATAPPLVSSASAPEPPLAASGVAFRPVPVPSAPIMGTGPPGVSTSNVPQVATPRPAVPVYYTPQAVVAPTAWVPTTMSALGPTPSSTPGMNPPLYQALVNDILSLYQGHPRPDIFNLYDEKAEFEDRLYSMKGRDEIRSMFYSTPDHFSISQTLAYTYYLEAPNVLILKFKQRWVTRPLDVEKVIDHVVILVFNSNGRIIRHEDRWDGKPLTAGPKVPGIGDLKERGRRLLSYIMYK
eukprot:GILJ01013075.1.p1 GENE.GILJ01013075.1~~GILJ01013075.1.p1  ORF type:complete len:293 (+),score=31.15 GILJ01013075.1:382-1260(+)